MGASDKGVFRIRIADGLIFVHTLFMYVQYEPST